MPTYVFYESMRKLVGRGAGCSPALIAVAAIVLLLVVTGNSWSQSIAKPVATIRLHTPEIINSLQFASFLDLAARLRGGTLITTDECRPALDNLTNKRLYLQEAHNRRIFLTEVEIDTQLAAVRQQTEKDLGLNQKLTDDQWRSIIQQNTGLGWQEYRQQFADGLSLQRLVVHLRPKLLEVQPPNVQEIERFYNANIQQFVQPERALIQHIHFTTVGLDEDDIQKARMRADEVLRQLQEGASFDDLVVKYSDDGTSRHRGGELGNRYIRRDDPAVIETLGAPFLDAAFTLSVGETSSVVVSKIGFHLLRIVDRVAPRLLTLEDHVLPGSTQTVGQQIEALVNSRRQNQSYLQAVEEIVEDLREQADINIFEKEVENVCQQAQDR